MTQTKRQPASGSSGSEKKPRLITEFFSSSKSDVSRDKSSNKSANVENGNSKTITDITQEEEKSKSINTENVDNSAIKTQESKSSTSSRNENPHSDSNITAPRKAIGTLDDIDFSAIHNFDKESWVSSLSEEQKSLLGLEIDTLHITWLTFLHKELTKPYFLKLKTFLRSQEGKTVFPPAKDIYSWSHLTPLPQVKCLILGQDPYHNFNQAHGLAFSVLEPTKPPPSLVNIYKALKIDFPAFEIPNHIQLAKDGRPGGGNLTKWAKRGVLMLNACLTVEAHKANSHANKGWEQFTEKIIETAITYARDENKQGFVIMAWGSPAQKRVAKFSLQLGKKDVDFFVIKSVHPSPLSAHRGFFDSHVFEKCNVWLKEHGKEAINWGLIEGNDVY